MSLVPTRELPPSWKFWHRVRVVPGGCWIWIGGRHPDGYGQFSVGARAKHWTLYAHRWALAIFGRSIGAGLEVDHLCFNRACVNPDHLDVVTHAENLRRTVAAGRRAARDDVPPPRASRSERSVTGVHVELPIDGLADELVDAVIERLDRLRPTFVVPKLACTPDEAAEALSLSVPVVRELVRRGELPHWMFGTRIVIPVAALNEWSCARAAERAQLDGLRGSAA